MAMPSIWICYSSCTNCVFTILGGVGAELNVSIFWLTYLTLDVLNLGYLPWFFAEQARVHESMNTYPLVSILQVLFVGGS